MKIEKITVEEAIDWTAHHHAFINPYNGCPVGCPFCFWLSQEGWENRIQIKTNIAEVLEKTLCQWPKDEFIYLGSVCDPFMELEKEYGLSKQCLTLIRDYEIPLLITTSATCDVISEEIPLLKSMKQRVIVVVELSRIKLVEEMNAGGLHAGIENANNLFEQGVEVWTTLSPILPGITNLDDVLAKLNPHIPVYVDSLQCEKDSVQAHRIMDWIRKDYPSLQNEYEKIVENQDLRYYTEILKEKEGNTRVLTFPFKL